MVIMDSFRFERTKRLLTATDYQVVFASNQSFKDRDFLILVRKQLLSEQIEKSSESMAKVPRLGLAVSKKNFKRAVDRNLIKRVIRESFRLHQQDLVGLDIVVMSRATTNVQDSKRLHQSLAHHWGQIIKATKDRAN